MGRLPKYYVYTFFFADTERVFYVGKGTGERWKAHFTEMRRGCQCRKCTVLRRAIGSRYGVDVRIVFRTDNEREAYAYERKLIEKIGLKNLCNVAPGMPDFSTRLHRYTLPPKPPEIRPLVRRPPKRTPKE